MAKDIKPMKPDEIFTREIEPRWKELAAICQKHNVHGMAAFVVPLTSNAGAIMLYLIPDRKGQVLPAIYQAYQLIDQSRPKPPAEGG